MFEFNQNKFNKIIKIKYRKSKINTKLYCKIYTIKNISRRSNKNLNISSKTHLKKFYRKFQSCIIFYNNILFFINEIAKIDKKYNIWTIFRIIKDIKYLFDFALTKNKNNFKFCQIYNINLLQNAFEYYIKIDIIE